VIVCLVTDRRRLAGRTASVDASLRCLAAQARFAVDAGVDLIQIRERDLDAAHLARIVRALAAIARGTRTRLVVNDRLDVALACGADGVHLRGDSIPTETARRLAPPGFVIGRSVRTRDDAQAAGVDYLIAGSVFPTVSKSGPHRLLGLDGLRGITAVSRVPVLAIGGVTPANAAVVGSAGAAGCAGIGVFMAGANRGDAVAEVCNAVPLHEIVSELRTRFDSVKTAT